MEGRCEHGQTPELAWQSNQRQEISGKAQPSVASMAPQAHHPWQMSQVHHPWQMSQVLQINQQAQREWIPSILDAFAKIADDCNFLINNG
uniref:Uncharacterized protein n=1 Tax=Manihot esculenta TaxID=3983 RepID=A0A2C9VPP9_MANES